MKSWRIPAWQHSSRELSCSQPQPSSAERMQIGERAASMRLLQHIASMVLLIGLLCHAAQAAGQPDPLADEIARQAAAKWMDVLARIDSEEETLAVLSCVSRLVLASSAPVAADR